MKKHLYKITHNTSFENFIDAFNDCIRYSKTIILQKDNEKALVEIPPSGDRSMTKTHLSICKDKFQSRGFNIEKM
ncbi:hypothetical protein Gferi_17790 [Geosporobacter ferrireducens]|uniref:Uncharacterized protein n=1 Tax=Geosporobacter ferrireducens TaxID=1424294 RepID=A0A1D8GK57_9FIRM|nr:hypothetical protein Gferi_17790 [Geosporobacter ferrireducens]